MLSFTCDIHVKFEIEIRRFFGKDRVRLMTNSNGVYHMHRNLCVKLTQIIATAHLHQDSAEDNQHPTSP